MEHEVNVPFPVKAVRAALADTARVARCVPGLQPDDEQRPADAEGTVAGRLRVKAGGSTITYRGSLTVTAEGDEFTVTGTGTEARGSGSVRLGLTVVPKPATEGEGTRLVCSGTVEGDGRLADVEARTARSAGVRLLERFGRALGESLGSSGGEATVETGAGVGADSGSGSGSGVDSGAGSEARPGSAATSPAAAAGGIGEPGDNDRVIPGIPGPGDHEAREAGEAPSERGRGSVSEEPAETGGTAEADGPGESVGTAESGGTGESVETGETVSAEEAASADDTAEEPAADTADTADVSDRPADETPGGPGGVFDAPVPPSSLDPVYDDEDQLSDEELNAAADAEAAHARRTMIGRSAEEVDHAPPRGRYAPVPVPEPIANSAALRWVGPAAAAVVAGAVVIGRALRRRRG